jgi:DNA invertase Pin-like site-specific DNA recombinase
LLKAVVRREIDQVCVWSIDRLGRSLQDLIAVLDELRQKGCELYIHRQAIDTNTPSGKLLFQMLGVFAEFEREIIRERIMVGQQRARAQGKRGRRSVIDEAVLARAQGLRAEGQSVRQIASALKIGIGTTCKALAQARSETVSVIWTKSLNYNGGLARFCVFGNQMFSEQIIRRKPSSLARC